MDKKEFTRKLGERIKAVRLELGISQAELARRCGKDQQHIELIENGKTTCTSYTLFIICESLSCPINRLFEFD